MALNECCVVYSMCGLNLSQGIVFVGIATSVISLAAVILSSVFLRFLYYADNTYNNHPPLANLTIFALVAFPMSVYQIILSALLLWQYFYTKGKVFLCSMWYVSHITILTLYFLLFSSTMFVFIFAKQYFAAFMSLLIGFAYEVTFIYFTLVVNGYIHRSLPTARNAY